MNADTPDLGSLVSHVFHATDFSRESEVAFAHGDAQVDDLHHGALGAGRQEEVGRLHVPVHQPASVRRLERIRQFERMLAAPVSAAITGKVPAGTKERCQHRLASLQSPSA